MADPVLVELTRGGVVESFHHGAVAVVDAKGGVVLSLGDIDRPIFPRSAVKGFQALPLIESGAADRFGLTPSEIALACASHSGEPEHAATAKAMLAKAGQDVGCLECGVHWPMGEAANRALAASGASPSALHNNCSGKHAGFVCLACGQGQSPKGYVLADHPVQRSVRETLEEITGAWLTAALRTKAPGVTVRDFAIVDITLKGSSGLELIKDLKAWKLDVPVLVLSMHDEALYAERAFRAGARGYITKAEASENVMNAIRCVLDGKIYASESFASGLLMNLVETGTPQRGSALNQLTDRELEVFYLIGQGRTTQEIAMSLNLGNKTIETYRARIKEKLNLKNAVELHHRAMNWVRDLDSK